MEWKVEPIHSTQGAAFSGSAFNITDATGTPLLTLGYADQVDAVYARALIIHALEAAKFGSSNIRWSLPVLRLQTPSWSARGWRDLPVGAPPVATLILDEPTSSVDSGRAPPILTHAIDFFCNDRWPSFCRLISQNEAEPYGRISLMHKVRRFANSTPQEWTQEA
jgi:hypothetical protein